MMFLATAFSSCVNEDYDMSQGIDMEMTLLKNASMPIGDVEKISVGELLVIDEDDEIISIDSDGNYALSFAGTGVSTELSVPEIAIDDISPEPATVRMSTGGFAGTVSGIEPEVISYKDIHGGLLAFSMDIDIDQELPSEVKGIRKIHFTPADLQLSMNFGIQEGTIYIAQGFKIVFSEHMDLSPLETSEYTVYGNVMTFNKDVKVTDRQPYICSFHIDDFAFGDEDLTISGGKSRLVYEDHIAFEGELFALTSDFVEVPDELSIQVKARIHDLHIEAAELKMDFDVDIEDTSFFSEIPEFLAGDNVCIDLYNPQLRLDIHNGTPVPFIVSAAVSAYKDNSKMAGLDLGPYDVNPESDSNIVIARRDSGHELPSETGFRYYIVPEIGDFFRNLPDEIRVSDVKMDMPDEYVVLAPGDRYDADLHYGLMAPLAFDKDLFLDFTQDIADLALDFSTGIASAELSLDILNSVPADFTVYAVGLDNEGNVIPDMMLAVDKVIAAGSHVSPVETSVTLTLKNPSKTLELNGLRLTMEANAGGSKYHGVALNRNQGLELKNIVLTLPDGITFMNDSEN